jgi:pyrroline-5-carboxylate reductase
MSKIGIIGCGNLGSSILNGLMASEVDQVWASRRTVNTNEFAGIPGIHMTTDNEEVIRNSEIILITLKPYKILEFLEEYSHLFDPKIHTIVSAASGISIKQITEKLSAGIGVYRIMPNTASAVQQSLTAICSSSDPLNRKAEVLQLTNAIGESIVIDEELMDAVTILGACGVAYVLRFIRGMIQGGIEVGFDAATATKIVSQTVKGAAELLIRNGNHPEAEIDKVTTPKGCTIVGLNEMEHAGFSSALIKGIVSSYEKIGKDD